MEHSFYLYSTISDSDQGFWGEKLDVVTAKGFIDETQCEKGDTLNIYVNSPGGSVFEATAMCAHIQRLRESGVTVNAYIDGIAASAASFLVMACDKVHCYKSSMLMVHKPMCFAWGNADELLKQAETLEAVENGTCMPLYMDKAKVDADTIKSFLKAETWMNADEMCETFDIELEDGEKEVGAFDPKLFKGCRNVPEQVLNAWNKQETKQEEKEPSKPEGWYYELLEKAIKSI